MIFIKLTISENKLVSGWLERVYLPWKYQMTHTIGRCHTPLQWSMAAINWAHHPLTQRCRWCSRGKEDEGASNARHASWKVQLFAHVCAFPTPLKKIMWPQTSAANYQITCCVVASHAINVKILLQSTTICGFGGKQEFWYNIWYSLRTMQISLLGMANTLIWIIVNEYSTD
jgi:hypothetical protein